MDETNWYEVLVQGGVAPRRARRALREFTEHRQDIIAERVQLGESSAQGESAADARLGSPQRLVEGMLARPELASWSRRKPWAAFALAPLLCLCALFVGLSVLTVFLIDRYKSAVGDLRSAPLVTHWITDSAALLVLHGVPIVVGGTVAVAAIHRRETSYWPAGGLLLISLIGACTSFQFVLPTGPEPPALSIGVGFSSAAWVPALARASLTAAVTLLPYAWARQARRTC